MAFLRFTRDKRGYENFYLVQPTNRRGKTPRLLYWFRTPPNVKVGRQAFDPEMRRALEAQNPDISFDWTALVETPIPPVVDTERWRERRRMERANRQSAAAEPDPEQPVESAVDERYADSVLVTTPAAVEVAVVAEFAEAVPPSADDGHIVAAPELVPNVERLNEPVAASNPQPMSPGSPQPGRRRRRRRRRRERPQNTPQGVPGSEPAQGESAGEPDSGDEEP